MSVKVSERIRDILMKVCPAFVHEPSPGGAVWHKCKCTAYPDSCVCVWHVKSKCPAGDWPQLSWLNVKLEENAKAAAIMAEKAVNACKSSNKGIMA